MDKIYDIENDEFDETESHDYLMEHFVPKVHFELLPMSSLVSNQDYQRSISSSHVKKAANEFNIYQINPVKVSRRDGKNYVFDGQHTIEIIALASGSRDIPVWCMIYDDLEYQAEADIFANQMKYKKSLQPIEVFNANIEAGNEKQIIIKDLVESYDLQINTVKGQMTISCISALEYIYDNYGFDGLDHTLMMAVGTWEGATGSLSATVLKGIALFFEAYKDKVSEELFMERIGRMSIKELIRTTKERGGGAQGCAEVLLLEYNKKAKARLPWAQLYNTRSKRRSRMAGIDDLIALEKEGINSDIMRTDAPHTKFTLSDNDEDDDD